MSRPWCKHYRGMHEKTTCEAGVVFKELTGYHSKGFLDACPCFGPGKLPCDKAEYPNAEEMAAHDAEMLAMLERTVKARKAIVEHLGGQWKRGKPGARGQIDCPICGAANALAFSRSGYNGHIHAACTTDGCVSWME
jgi:hypothetical protein